MNDVVGNARVEAGASDGYAAGCIRAGILGRFES